MSQYIVGIDPGQKGALTILNSLGELVEVHDIPLIENKVTKRVKIRKSQKDKEIDAESLKKGEKVKRTVVKEVKEYELDIARLIELIPEGAQCIIERVGAMPGQGVVSMFSFGETYGIIRASAIAKNCTMHKAGPVQWQKHFGISNKEDNIKTLIANKSLELYPQAQLYTQRGALKDGRSDSILLARFLFETLDTK